MLARSNESSAVAIHLLALTQNDLAGGILPETAHGDGILVPLAEKLAAVRVHDAGVLEMNLVVRARRPDNLTGADIVKWRGNRRRVTTRDAGTENGGSIAAAEIQAEPPRRETLADAMASLRNACVCVQFEGDSGSCRDQTADRTTE